MIKKKFKITGMHCVSCSINIDGELEDTKGVKSAKTSYAKQECEVEFDPQLVQEKKIVEVIGALGYSIQFF